MGVRRHMLGTFTILNPLPHPPALSQIHMGVLTILFTASGKNLHLWTNLTRTKAKILYPSPGDPRWSKPEDSVQTSKEGLASALEKGCCFDWSKHGSGQHS